MYFANLYDDWYIHGALGGWDQIKIIRDKLIFGWKKHSIRWLDLTPLLDEFRVYFLHVVVHLVPRFNQFSLTSKPLAKQNQPAGQQRGFLSTIPLIRGDIEWYIYVLCTYSNDPLGVSNLAVIEM